MPTPIDRPELAGLVEQLSRLLIDNYAFPETGARLAARLGERHAAGAYDDRDAEALAELLTADLQSVTADLHLRVKFHHRPLGDEPDEHALRAVQVRAAAQTLGGIAGVRRHPDNVAVLAIGPVLYGPELSGTAITSAMQLVASAATLVLDLRTCRGGTPEATALLLSYLLDEPTHLLSFYQRPEDRTVQSWTVPFVPGPRFGGAKPVYVLTSATTFSGGEEIAYDLQQLGRATIVGERTAGGAHPRMGARLHTHLEAAIPVAVPTHPLSGTNWEGTGVVPDVAVPAEQALDVALARARP